MRLSFLNSLVFIGLVSGSLSASAQRAVLPVAPRPATSRRLAVALAEETASPATTSITRLACTKLAGQVLGLNGKPIIGATITVKGTQHLCITDSEGKYLVEVPVYQGQVLEVEAAGYTTREVSLTDCSVPAIGLELAEGTKVKKNGKRAGQITRFGTADMQ